MSCHLFVHQPHSLPLGAFFHLLIEILGLRSKYVLKHEPPQAFYAPGKESLAKTNPAPLGPEGSGACISGSAPITSTRAKRSDAEKGLGVTCWRASGAEKLLDQQEEEAPSFLYTRS